MTPLELIGGIIGFITFLVLDMLCGIFIGIFIEKRSKK